MTTTPLVASKAARNPAATLSLPEPLRRALADSLALDHPDLPWQPPATLPPEDLIRAGIGVLEAQLRAVDDDTLDEVVGKILVTWPTYGQQSTVSATLRHEGWYDALSDLPADLLVECFTRAARHPFRYPPNPGQFRAFIEPEFTLRRRQLHRARLLLEAANGRRTVEAPKPPPRDAPGDRLRVLLKWAKVRGDWAKAQRLENELAAIEGRAPEAFDVPAQVLTPPPPPAPPVSITPSPANAAALKRALARRWREMGVPAKAAALEAEADRLAPRPDEYRAIPEARQ